MFGEYWKNGNLEFKKPQVLLVISHKVPHPAIYSQKGQFLELNCAPVVSLVLALAQSCMLNHVKPCTFPNVLSRRPILDLSSRTNSVVKIQVVTSPIGESSKRGALFMTRVTSGTHLSIIHSYMCGSFI
jgi:hypothetical protein